MLVASGEFSAESEEAGWLRSCVTVFPRQLRWTRYPSSSKISSLYCKRQPAKRPLAESAAKRPRYVAPDQNGPTGEVKLAISHYVFMRDENAALKRHLEELNRYIDGELA